MEKLVRLCQQHAIKLTISVHPWRTQVRQGEVKDLHVKHWQNFARQHKINFINLYPLFVKEGNPDLIIAKNYIPQDNHWNAAGHRKVAERLFPIMTKDDAEQDFKAIVEKKDTDK